METHTTTITEPPSAGVGEKEHVYPLSTFLGASSGTFLRRRSSHFTQNFQPKSTAMEKKNQNQAEKGEKQQMFELENGPNPKVLMLGQIFLCEVVATALLMFGVCTGCMDGLTSTPISPLQAPIASGCLVAALVTTFAHISDCHMNPAVSALFLSLGKIDFLQFVVYIAAELVGAVTGVGILRAIVPESLRAKNPGHCETVIHKDLTPINGAIFEFILTSLLVFMICSVLDKRNNSKQDSVAVKFGMAIIALSFIGGSFTGTSMNPARTFGPALWANAWTNHWVYWAGPMTAGFMIPQVYMLFFEKELRNPDL